MPKFFIPTEKQKYVLLEDWTVLLYPIQGYCSCVFPEPKGNFNLKTSSFYSEKYDKKTEKFLPPILDVRVEILDDDRWRNNYGANAYGCVRDWFALSDTPVNENLSKLIHNPIDLHSIYEKTYVVFNDYINHKNKQYKCFTSEDMYHHRNWVSRNSDTNDVVRVEVYTDNENEVLENRTSVFKGDLENEISYSNKVIEESIKMCSVPDKIVGELLPMYFTIKKGTQFSIKKMDFKIKHLKKFSLTEIHTDKGNLLLLREDLNNANVEIIKKL